MGIFDNEIDLPGVITQVEADYSYGYDSSLFGTTDSVMIIGTAFNGPVGQPTAVYSPEHAEYIFGGVYDSAKRQEVSLVAGIQDAWYRGCRTIYAVRIGGKPVYKDFDFKIDTEYKLRVSSMFPSNTAKECYLRYDGTKGLEEVTFYKPAERATVAEKKRGLVNSTSAMMKNTIRLALDNGMTADDRLVDFINLFNSNTFNNVLMLSIVDKDGNDVTNSPDLYWLTIGMLYSGVYFIGREYTTDAAKVVTETSFELVNATGSNKPYSRFDGVYFRQLIRNTDVSLPYPIYDISMATLRDNIKDAGVLMVEPWDFLDTADVSDRIFVPDEVDYEETTLSNFEIYKRLGNGFAITAKAIQRKDSEGNEKKPRIKESDADEASHVISIEDGIYSIIQDANVKYRVLTCVSAEDTIKGSLPRAEDFRIASANDVIVLNETLNIKANVEKNDLTAPLKYSIVFDDLETGTGKVSKLDGFDDVDTTNVYQVIGSITSTNFANYTPADFKPGTMFLVGTDVYRANLDSFTKIDAADLTGKKFIVGNQLMALNTDGEFEADETNDYDYILGDSLDHIFVYKKGTDDTYENIGDLNSLLSKEDDKLIISAEDTGVPLYENKIVVRSTMFDTITVEELCDKLNDNEIFGRLFTVSLTDTGSIEKDDFVTEAEHAKTGLNTTAVAITDRILTYDYDLYIPYRTNDNFLRQLAQHCTYTELKTGPTHGMMGVKRFINLSLSEIANRVNAIASKDFDLYAKNAVGHNMLTAENLPYPIGKNVSLVFGQYTFSMERDNYKYMSNGAAGYAAMVSCLPLDQSSTGQGIELTDLDVNLTSSQLGRLTAAGIVTLKESFTKGIVVTDGITMAPADSIFRRLSTSRIVGAVEELIRAAAEPFIGKENHTANRNALNTAIKGNLDKLVGVLVEKYDFEMNMDTSINKLSYIEINYQVVPIYEIREVRNSIKMTDTITSKSTATA